MPDPVESLLGTSREEGRRLGGRQASRPRVGGAATGQDSARAWCQAPRHLGQAGGKTTTTSLLREEQSGTRNLPRRKTHKTLLRKMFAKAYKSEIVGRCHMGGWEGSVQQRGGFSPNL